MFSQLQSIAADVAVLVRAEGDRAAAGLEAAGLVTAETVAAGSAAGSFLADFEGAGSAARTAEAATETEVEETVAGSAAAEVVAETAAAGSAPVRSKRIDLTGTALGESLRAAGAAQQALAVDELNGGEWQPHLLVMGSAGLAKIGKVGDGLYTMRDFSKNETIASEYPGKKVRNASRSTPPPLPPPPLTPYLLPLTPHPSPIIPQPSPLIPHPSPLTLHPSPLIPHPSPLTPHPPSLIPHPSPLTPLLCLHYASTASEPSTTAATAPRTPSLIPLQPSSPPPLSPPHLPPRLHHQRRCPQPRSHQRYPSPFTPSAHIRATDTGAHTTTRL